MKSIIRCLFLTFFISTFAYAAEPQCPSISSIRNAQFISASNSAFDLWLVYTAPTQDDWGTVVFFDSKYADSPAAAIKLAQKKILTLPLHEPKVEVEEDKTVVCGYLMDEESNFIVAALNPFHLPTKKI